MKDWKKFTVNDLFDLKRGKGILNNKRKLGSIPYVSAKNNNNGVEQYIDINDYLFSNALGWINDGEGGVGYCFYHPYTFRPSHHVTVLTPKNFTLNVKTGLFFSTIISLSRQKFSRGWSINNKRAGKEILLLPTDSNGEVDLRAINIIMNDLINKSLAYREWTRVVKNIKNFNNEVADFQLRTSDWKWLRVEALFLIKKGKRYVNHQLVKGEIPYVRASAFNNGVTGSYEFPNNALIHKNALSFACNGSVGTCFYHPYEFVASDDIIVLTPKLCFDREHFLFFKVIFECEKRKYSSARKVSLERFLKTKIKVPVNIKGEIDLDGIKSYIQSLRNYKLTYKEHKIESMS